MDQTNPLIQDIRLRVGDFDSKLKEMREKIRVSKEKKNQVRKVAYVGATCNKDIEPHILELVRM